LREEKSISGFRGLLMAGKGVLGSSGFKLFVLSGLALGVFLAMFCSCDSSQDSCNEKVLAGPQEDVGLQGMPENEKIPVIFDTDICDDIDDTWALALLLKCPEFDVKLVTTAVGDTLNRARVVARLLEIAGRTDIPIGIGVRVGDSTKGHKQDEWVKGYELSSFAGTIYDDGVEAIIDTIMESSEPVTVLAVGPLPNIAEALKREPRIAQNARFVGMHGSVRRGYDGKSKPDPEYNVVTFIKEAQTVFTAAWDMTITPLDTCGIVRLSGKKYQRLLAGDDPLARAVIENYRIWAKGGIAEENKDLSEAEVNKRADEKINTGSSTLFDTVAIYLAISTEFVKMEKLRVKITDDGYTVIDEEARKITCATEWKDLDAFENFLVARLTK
jgi:inosine-uridine nucleoside N-ribohydrolase